MPTDDNNESPSSWNESRRLIISQLRSMDASIKELGTKIESLNEKGRDRIVLLDASVATQMSDMKVRIAMLEVRAKIWGGMVGFVGGAVASGIIDIMIGRVMK